MPLGLLAVIFGVGAFLGLDMPFVPILVILFGAGIIVSPGLTRCLSRSRPEQGTADPTGHSCDVRLLQVDRKSAAVCRMANYIRMRHVSKRAMIVHLRLCSSN